jgi:hypothetical protein
MIKWTSIAGFHNVRKLLKSYPNLNIGTVTYRAKVKLHGQNGGVSVYPDGRVEAQSRETILTPKEDIKNFCKQCVLASESFWSNLADDEVITIYGEWCGPGIEKGTAINQTEEKIFAIFGIQLGDSETDEFGYDHGTLIIDPKVISRILGVGGELPNNVRVLPWQGDEVDVNYTDETSLQDSVDNMNTVVQSVEAIDPWVKDTFGIEGMGEGVVYYPISLADMGSLDRHEMSIYSFKAKGKKHENVKNKNAVEIEPAVAASIDEFVTMVVTPARLDQGAQEAAGGEFHKRHIGSFLKWMGQDVQKETVDELEASGLKWDQVVKPVGIAARTWYLDKL